jgi:hypothetical protein
MVLRRRARTTERTGAELLRAWSAATGGAPPGTSPRLRDAAEDLAIAVDRRPGDLQSALTRFGWQAGNDGWPLAEISRWVESLAEVGGPGGRGLLTFEMGMALSAAWTDGFLHGAQQDDCIEPTTGLARLSVLQLRLQQVYEHCAALGVDPDLVYALIVVDASLVEHPQLERTAARVAMAAEAKTLFSTGETLVCHDDRLLILASRTPELSDRVAVLDAALHSHPLLRYDPITTWVERLPSGVKDVSAFLADITA